MRFSNICKPIGGFFGLEEKLHNSAAKPYHSTQCFSYGRACLAAIFSIRKISKLYLPFYICREVMDVIEHYKVPYQFYGLRENLKINEDIVLGPGEHLLVVNYFGLMSEYIAALSKKYSNYLIIDNTQAFYEKTCVDSWSFNSCRKFFGVPDGAYLYSPLSYSLSLSENDIDMEYLVNKFYGFQELAYKQYRVSENNIGYELKLVSSYSKHILNKIDYEYIATLRRENFLYLSNFFSNINMLNIENLLSYTVPMCYPLLLKSPIDRGVLLKEKIFTPIYWPDIDASPKYEFEGELINNLISLPIDQRITLEDCNKMIGVVSETYNDKWSA